MELGRRFALPLLGLAGLAIFVALHTWSPDTYTDILTAIMIRPTTDTPFVDLQYLFTTAECWRKGVDVYLINPCDPLGRPEGYSPLWLRAPILFADRPWSVWYGVVLAGLFFLSLAALPPGRRWRDQVILGAAVFSSVTIYGIERGNADVIMFMMALTAGLCAARTAPVRLAGYGMVLLAGLLKFYPLVGLVLVARERLARFLIVAGIATGAILAFGLEFREELVKTLRNIPRGSYFGDNVGAQQLPGSLGVALRPILGLALLPVLGKQGGLADAMAASQLLIIVAAVTLCGAAGIMAAWIVRHRASRLALLALPSPDHALLVVGAALVCGCFFAGQSVAYRAIMLLLVLPGLMALGRDPTDRRSRLISGWTVGAILLVMWRLTVIQALEAHGLQNWNAESGGGSAIASCVWIVFELAWWWIVSVLIAILAAFALDSPVGRHLHVLIGRAR